MKLACSQLLNMHVYTTSGVSVGKVLDFSIDIDTGMVVEYAVGAFLRATRTIPHTQVVRYEADRVIVDDQVSATEHHSSLTSSFSSSDPLGVVEDQAS